MHGARHVCELFRIPGILLLLLLSMSAATDSAWGEELVCEASLLNDAFREGRFGEVRATVSRCKETADVQVLALGARASAAEAFCNGLLDPEPTENAEMLIEVGREFANLAWNKNPSAAAAQRERAHLEGYLARYLKDTEAGSYWIYVRRIKPALENMPKNNREKLLALGIVELGSGLYWGLKNRQRSGLTMIKDAIDPGKADRTPVPAIVMFSAAEGLKNIKTRFPDFNLKANGIDASIIYRKVVEIQPTDAYEECAIAKARERL